jgi:outer membrane protein insertion porin family
VKENNWLGRGIKLQSELNLSTEKVSGNFTVYNPNYNFSGNAVNAGIDVSNTDRTAASGFKSSKTGFNLGTNFEQYEDLYFSPEFFAVYEDVEVESTASTSIKKMEGTFHNLDFGYGIAYDKRNQTFQPTEGYKTSFSQTLPLILDSSSIKNTFAVNAYHDFTDDIIGSLKFYTSTIHGVDEDVRLTNRLFLPSKKLRGFNTRKVGPKDGADWVGGNYTSAFSVEAQLPNILPESYKTDFSLFLDTGNVWNVDYSSSVDDTNKLRSSVGISANVFTAVGPLSFTVAQGITKATNDETETFNFRLGTSF